MPDDKKEPITPPSSDVNRKLVRTALESAAGFVPGGSALANLYKITHPPKSDHDRKVWERAVSERSNEHDEQLAEHGQILRPTETISGLPAEIVAWFIKGCPDGLGMQHVDRLQLQKVFPDAAVDDIDEAIAELGQAGLLNIRYHHGGWHASLTAEAYEQLDSQIVEFDTLDDATTVAKHMIEKKTGVARALHEITGWSRRRFNPAFQFLLKFFPDGRISSTLQAEYPASSVMIVPEDRVRLRKFVQSREGNAQ